MAGTIPRCHCSVGLSIVRRLDTMLLTPKSLRPGDRVIIAWRHLNGNEGARFAVIARITKSGTIYAGLAGENFYGPEFPLPQKNPKRGKKTHYTRTLIADTTENRAIYAMPERAAVDVVFKKIDRAKSDAKMIWDGLPQPQRNLLLILNNHQRVANFTAKTFHALERAGLITSNFPEQLTELGSAVRAYGETLKQSGDST